VHTQGMPTPMKEAKAWVAREIATHGQRQACNLCQKRSTENLCCSTCDHSFCRECLGMVPGAMWSLGFQCPTCIVEDAGMDDKDGDPDPALAELARSMGVQGFLLVIEDRHGASYPTTTPGCKSYGMPASRRRGTQLA